MPTLTAFQKLLEILDRLLGPGGCPWDREQTMQTLRCTVLEETCELIEAIDLDHDPHIQEELGDLFLNAVFLCKLAQKEQRFNMESVIEKLNEKLIRRHPHVFGESQASNPDEVIELWNAVKEQEKTEPQSVLDSIPKGLPALARAQKSLKRMKKAGYDQLPEAIEATFSSEEDLGEKLLALCAAAQKQGFDCEVSLRKTLAHLERDFRAHESNQADI